MALFVDDIDPLLFYRKIAELAIKNLNPKPGLIFQKTDRTSYIAADVFVKKEGSQWITTLNEDNHIKLKLEENSQNLLSNSLEQDLKEKFQEAKWLIKNLECHLLILRKVFLKNKSKYFNKFYILYFIVSNKI